MAMTENKIRGQWATFFVNGAKRGDGVLLLYPDKLTAVSIKSVRTWIYLGVPAVYIAVWFLVFHTRHQAVEWEPLAVWYLPAWWVWHAVDKSRGIRKVAAGGDGVTVIPLDQVTSARCWKGGKAALWLGISQLTVTTADGTEYRFDGLREQWVGRLADALTARGREVHVESGTLTVMPWAPPGEN